MYLTEGRSLETVLKRRKVSVGEDRPPPAKGSRMSMEVTTPDADSSSSSEQSFLSFQQPIVNNSFYFDQIEAMFAADLYSNVLSLAGKVLTMAERSSDILSQSEMLTVLQYCGDSALKTLEFNRAEHYYRRCHQLHKCVTSKMSSYQKELNLAEDCELLFKLHLCQIQIKKPADALQTLQTIPVRMRTAKMHMALGKLLQQNGMERAAITSYKMVLLECPLAMDAVEALLSLGLKEVDVESISLPKLNKMPNPEWYCGWLKGNCAYFSREYSQANIIFNELQEKTLLHNNRSLLVTMGTSQAHAGDYVSAIRPLRLAHINDPNDMTGMDLLAYLYWTEKRLPDLEKLMQKLVELNYNDDRSEAWIALGYYAQLTNRSNRGLYFAHRSLTTTGRKSVEALIAKGIILLDLKRYTEALDPFREALVVSPFRYEPHKGIVDCYIGLQRFRDAHVIASAASRKIGPNPRILTLCASALKLDPPNHQKAKGYLQKALIQDYGYLPALQLLVEVYEQEGQLTAACALLQEYLSRQSGTSQMHCQLANLQVKNGMEERAADSFGVALRLDSANREAREGLNRLDPTSRRGNVHDSTYEAPDEIDIDEDEDDDVRSFMNLFRVAKAPKTVILLDGMPILTRKRPFITLPYNNELHGVSDVEFMSSFTDSDSDSQESNIPSVPY